MRAVSQDHDGRCWVSLQESLEDQGMVPMRSTVPEAATDAGAAQVA